MSEPKRLLDPRNEQDVDELAEVIWLYSDENDDDDLEWENNHARSEWRRIARGVLEFFEVFPV